MSLGEEAPGSVTHWVLTARNLFSRVSSLT